MLGLISIAKAQVHLDWTETHEFLMVKHNCLLQCNSLVMEGAEEPWESPLVALMCVTDQIQKKIMETNRTEQMKNLMYDM